MIAHKVEGPVGVSLRRALPSDQARIRAMVRRMRLNPLDLNWQHFVIAQDPQERLIGCGQIKTHRDGSSELASIAVSRAFRNRGIATQIIRQLLEGAASPTYLTCRASLAGFYQRFGFRSVDLDEMSPYFRRIYRLAGTMMALVRKGDRMVVMRRG